MSNKIATREAYGKALVKLGKINDDVVVLDADLSKSTKTVEFAKIQEANENCSNCMEMQVLEYVKMLKIY